MLKYHFSAKTDVGLVRKANEDNLGNAQTPNGHVFVVCDGMGGHVGGAKASQIAVSSILEFFIKQEYDNLFTAIDRSLQFANEQIYAVSKAEPELKGMGTTATILIVKNDACYVGHVGDSRIYLKSDGKLNRITKDHSFVQTLVDSGVISDEQAESHPQKNQILKALGIAPIVEPTVGDTPILPKKGDVFLLCSDGMSGMVNDTSMEMMIDDNDLDRSTSILIQAANDSGGHDNITVTLVGIQESPHIASIFKHFNPIPLSAFSSTHILEEKQNSDQSFFKNKYFYIAASLGLFIICTIGWFILKGGDKVRETPKLGDKVNQYELSNYDCGDLERIKDQGNYIAIENGNGEIENTVCKCKIFIEDSMIVKIEPYASKGENNPDESEDQNAKTIKTSTDEVSKAKKEGWVEGERAAGEEDWESKTVKDKKGKDVKMKKKPASSVPNEQTVTSDCKTEMISYTVEVGDGYDKIANKHKRCQGLTAQSLKDQNDGKELKANETIKFECKCKDNN
jgi:serine/threonine protein phosphatase PrpC